MAYSFPEIDIWAKMSQPLARIGEYQKKRKGDSSANLDLDIQIYNARRDCEYEYNQDSDSDNLFQMMNYLYALCFPYILTAQATVAGGGNITPITPIGSLPNPYDFEVSASSFIATGETTITFPSSWQGLNILFVRNSITQSTVNQGGTYYSWVSATRQFTLIGGAAQATELFQIYPIV